MHNTRLKTALAATAAAATLLLAGPARADDPTIEVQIAPPAPRVEVVPGPRQGFVWVAGHWQWRPRLGQYTWAPGHWVAVRPGWVYVQPGWVAVGGRWVYRPGRWARPGDRDGDGIPNRFDRHPNNGYRP